MPRINKKRERRPYLATTKRMRHTIRSSSLLRIPSHDPFPIQLRFLEVEQQRHLQACDIQVAEHLGDVRVCECTHHFRIGDDLVIDDDVGHQLADEMTPVVNGISPLLLCQMAAGVQLND